MRYIELLINDRSINGDKQIDEILTSKGFYWLVDSEIENSKIEIKNNTIIWYEGTFYSGRWEFGIFKDGIFHGEWINGIFEGGKYKGSGM